MPIPLTSGQFRTKRSDMQIGDYIACKYTATSGVAGVFSDFGALIETAQANEIPVTGTATPAGYFYFIKGDKGLLLSDRVVQTNISWDVLNAAKMIQGVPYLLNSIIPILSSNTSYAPIVLSQSNTYSNLEQFKFYAAFDGNLTSMASLSTPTGSFYIDFGVNNEKAVKCYSLYCGTDYSLRYNQMPNTWILYGSNNNGTTWTPVDSRGGETWSNGQRKTYFFNNNVKYRNYMLTITASNGGGQTGFSDMTLSDDVFLIRSLSGGNAYLKADGTASLTNQGLGACPPNNEWDTYIVNSTLGGKIAAGDDSVWHWNNGNATLVGDSMTSTGRNFRGPYLLSGTWYGKNIVNWVGGGITSSYASPTVGFRPVLEYPEDSKCTNLWY